MNAPELLAEFFIFMAAFLAFAVFVHYGNVLSLAHAGFFILGYGAFFISFRFGIPLLIAVFLTALLSLALAYVLAISSLKFQLYFPMITFAFAELIRRISMEKTGLKLVFDKKVAAVDLILIFIFSLLTYLALSTVLKSRHGKILKALKEDRIALAASGENPERLKALLFIASVSFASVSGSLHAYYFGFNYEHSHILLLLLMPLLIYEIVK